MAIIVQVRFCPSGAPTFDESRTFLKLPRRGESIIREEQHFVIVEIDWQENGLPLLIAHGLDRPRAQAMLKGS
jgi:hypothetical protein